MKKLISTLSLFIIMTFVSFGQTHDDYKETLQKMLKISGSEESYHAAINQMFTMFKQQYSAVNEETWTSFEAEFKNTSINDLLELIVPVYQKHMTIEDLKELIKFYETPVGKKFALKTPLIVQESMQVGQQWGMKIGQDFAKKMKDKGY
ncbi:MAG: DUF2059 domain-containing protein [Saprospiraceae bacterium]|jgi:hypothetical protein|nr:DUF2059 domain-containing protein [Saprospiraceae bacterium]